MTAVGDVPRGSALRAFGGELYLGGKLIELGTLVTSDIARTSNQSTSLSDALSFVLCPRAGTAFVRARLRLPA